MSAMISTANLTKRFVKAPDLAAIIAGKLGAPVSEQVVHAVDGVDLDVKKGEVVGLEASPAAASPPLGA